MQTSRREFLKLASVVPAGFLGLRHALAKVQSLEDAQTVLGALEPDPYGLLMLPRGFRYRVFSQVGEKMDDGLLVPGLHDGMAAFPGPNGRTILVRNHEMSAGSYPGGGAFGWTFERLGRLDPDRIYDSGHGRPPLGGTTTVVFNTDTQQVEKQFLSLAGTVRNCAGGPTPWNTWISCEETQQRANERFEKDHGYNFEVPVTTDIGLADPIPLTAMGRFTHEAVAVDPRTSIVYQTEDDDDGLIYRFLPREPERLHAGGKLQALSVIGRPSCDMRNWMDVAGQPAGLAIEPGKLRDVAWIDLEDIQSPANDLRHRGFEAGAARFARAEGMWYGRRAVYWACTSGGRNRKGQIWRYVPSQFEGQADEKTAPGQLELFLEPNDRRLVENCDNLTVAPWGDLILTEDGPNEQFVVGVRPDGTIYQLGKNMANHSEIAGPTFSPDGTTLFLNIQHMGISLAVTGPWPTATD